MKNIAKILLKWESIREMISPSLIFSILGLSVALILGIVIQTLDYIYGVSIIAITFIAIILLLRLDEITVTFIIAVSIFVDSYLSLGAYLIAMQMALVLFFICYFGQSADHPWTKPHLIWLWGLFLILTIYPTFNGIRLTNSIANYLNLVPGAFIIFWLGNLLAKDILAVRRVFQLLSVMATLIAIHTIIQATTGVFLFAYAQTAAILDKYSNFQIAGSDISRASSFFGNPNGVATFLAISCFLPFGLLMESKQLWVKVLYLLEMMLILLALLQTYSTGAWIGVLIGILAFLFLTGCARYSVLVFLLIVTLIGITLTLFPSQVSAQLLHANNQSDLSLHLGNWQTATRVIEAFPLFGVGIGDQAYLIRAESFRVSSQTAPQAEPDNSYLQWGAIAGIPVMLIFLLLLGTTFWFSWRNWLVVDIRYRQLLGGGIAALIALSINSLTVDGWTDPNNHLGWLIAGIIASPLIRRCLNQQSVPSFDKTASLVHINTKNSIIDIARKSSIYE